MVAQVYINTGSAALDKPFDYIVPPKLEKSVVRGVRVKVPFGGGNVPKEAYVSAVLDRSAYDELKEIRSVSDEFPVLSERAIELCFYMRKKYFCTFSEAARIMLPPGCGTEFEEWVSLCSDYREKAEGLRSLCGEQIVRLLEENDGSAEFTQIKSQIGKSARASLNSLIKKGICEKSYRDKRRVNERFVRVAYYSGEENPMLLAARIERRSRGQAEVLRLLSGGARLTVPDIIRATGATRNAVEALHLKGLVEFDEAELLRNPLKGKETGALAPSLTEEQKIAVNAVRSGGSGAYLLHGVTGSGKTEVFMRLAEDALKKGKQAIVLVPEISLTPQMTDRFYNRFGDRVAVLHSALSLGERLDEWKRIKRGEAAVVVGARSAIFAPCDSIGIIIIDEEHEQSYKSESSPRYHARDIAEYIAAKSSCPLLLASATPSVESYFKAERGIYRLIEMKERFNKNPLPEVFLEDMRRELAEGNKTVLSRRLASEMQQNLVRGEQTVLFLNRRGYSTFVSCRDCGFVFVCPRCSVSLTYHKSGEYLTCHYCGYRERMKTNCPKCGSPRLKEFGKGTQKAQSHIEGIFPAASVLRMDADTTSGKSGHEKLLKKFSEEKSDILLGTQMVTKGLDFENVTLVGVLAADASLNIDDFRAQERTFNLIAQVCGRAGRGKKRGRAVVQTYMPDNPTLRLACMQDYKAFYKEEIKYREEFFYPPFCDIINIIISSSDEEEARTAASVIAMKLKTALRTDEEFILYEPSKAPVYKVQDRYRYRVWLKCRADDGITDLLRETVHCKYGKRKSDISVVADVNPYNMN